MTGRKIDTDGGGGQIKKGDTENNDRDTEQEKSGNEAGTIKETM